MTKPKLGFTLIETLVGVGVFAVLAAMTSIMLFAALRGARRAAAVAQVRNEGSYAMGVMSQKLRFASGVPDCTVPNSVTFTSAPNNGVTTFSCAGTSITSTGPNLISSKVQTAGCSITCSPTGDQVNIVFTLVPAGVPQSVVDKASVTFDSQVQIRNAR